MYIYVIIIDDFIVLSQTVIVLYFLRLSHIILYLCINQNAFGTIFRST